MTAMLNTLLDINQIEVGAVKAEPVEFPINELLDRIRERVDRIIAQAAGLQLRVLPCAAWIRSDPRLLEQMIRNLLSNAIKYTQRGRVLVGCRRRAGVLRIEVWDTGLGIPKSELAGDLRGIPSSRQPRPPAKPRPGTGALHRQKPGRIARSSGPRALATGQGVGILDRGSDGAEPCGADGRAAKRSSNTSPRRVPHHSCSILIIEDDPEVREHLELFLEGEGYSTATAVDGPSALTLVGALSHGARPRARRLQSAERHERRGSVSDDAARTQLSRPVHHPHRRHHHRRHAQHRAPRLRAVQQARQIARTDPRDRQTPRQADALCQSLRLVPPIEAAVTSESSIVYVVDDDDQVRGAIRVVLEDSGRHVETYASCEAFLQAFRPGKSACLLIDAYLPGMSGLDLLKKLRADGHHLPAIMITGDSDVAMAVEAMKAGALDFIEKPIGRDELVHSIDRALELAVDSQKLAQWRTSAATHLAGLTPRQRDVMERVLAGHPSKNIAADLGISQRTVENHRASIMKRTGSKSLPALARLALVAAGGDTEPPAGA